MLTKQLATKIRIRRIELGKRQAEAARLFGMAQGTYSKVECGVLLRPAITLEALCQFLKWSPEELFNS